MNGNFGTAEPERSTSHGRTAAATRKYSMLDLALNLLIGLTGGAVVVALWMLRAVRRREPSHRGR